MSELRANRPGRRNNHEGSIRQRPNGLWEGQFVAGYRANNKPIRRSLYGKTKQEVRTKLRDTIQQLERNEYIEPSRMTVGQWLDEWWKVYCLPLKKNSTCTGYEDEINLHIKPYLRDVRLQELKPQVVQLMVNGLIQEGKAASTVRKAYTVLHAALDQAVINQLLLHNPSHHAILPKMEQPEIRFFTLEEQRRFIAALPDSTSGRALYFILGTGIRAAELTGLRWSDVCGSSFIVRQTIRRNRDFREEAACRTYLEASSPKTRAGRRTIPLSHKMQEVLAVQRQMQEQMKEKKGDAWNPDGLVFCSEVGTPYEGRNLTRTLHRTLKKAKLEIMGVHALRHTFATRAIESGMDVRTLSEILGHTKVALTLQLYAHSSIETKIQAMQGMDAFL